MTSTIGVKKIQYPNGIDSITIDSSGSAAITTANITTANVTNATATGTINTPSINGGQIGGRRNIVINGAMQVAQRGTSFTSVAGSAYHLDRFRTGMGDTTARFTVTQATAALNGFANSLKYDCTTAESSLSNAGARLFIQHRLEGQDLQQLKKGTSDAEKVTVSFYVKTNKSGVYTVELYDVDNTRSISQTITVSDANWNRYTLTFDGDTTGTLDNNNANSLDLIIHLIAGTTYTGGTFSTSWSSATENTRVSSSNVNIGDSTDNNFEITGVQLEVGSQATPFEHRSFGEELALCQRYYQVKNGSYHPGNAVGSNKINAGFTFPVSFRATPSTPPNVSVHRSGNQTVTASIDSVVCSGDRSSGSIRFVGHTVSDETAYNVYISGNLELDAEL
tara:strand:- start:278 stop:1456 length:1179 start_codon:yes stop_codon:yes gene_type:complete